MKNKNTKITIMTSITLSIILLSSTITVGTIYANHSTSDVVGIWHMDEGAGQTVADSSSNSNDGNRGTSAAVEAAKDPNWVAGKFDDALDFDGSGDLVTIPDDPSLDLTTDGTICAWIDPDNFTIQAASNQRVVMKGADAFTNEDAPYQLILDPDTAPKGHVRVILGDTTFPPQTVIGTADTLDSTAGFQHICTTWDNSDVKIYVDGAIDVTVAKTVTPNANGEPLFIGTYRSINAFNESGHFDGIIDELQIYSVALSAKEIEALFDGLSIDDPMFFSNGSISDDGLDVMLDNHDPDAGTVFTVDKYVRVTPDTGTDTTDVWWVVTPEAGKDCDIDVTLSPDKFEDVITGTPVLFKETVSTGSALPGENHCEVKFYTGAFTDNDTTGDLITFDDGDTQTIWIELVPQCDGEDANIYKKTANDDTTSNTFFVNGVEVEMARYDEDGSTVIDADEGWIIKGTGNKRAPLDDRVVGSDLHDKITPGWGDDTVCAGDGDDLVQGSWGDDTLFGEAGEDLLKGGWGDDDLDGGPDDDEAQGGKNSDTCDAELESSCDD